jgi:murein DD-endopeptidase MepM/ murein hydrolase activator NlpD
MRALTATLVLWAALPALAQPKIRWTPEKPGDGRPFLVVVEGLPAGAEVRATFLKQELAFVHDEGSKAYVALAAVPLGTLPRAHPLHLTAAADGGTQEATAQVKTAWIRYPLAEVRIKPQPGAVKKGEKAVDGRAKIREALARKTLERFWSLPFHRPLESKVTEYFGVRRLYMKMRGEEIVKKWRGRHMGLDLDGNGGEPIGAVADGVVATTGHFFGTGKCVYLDHGQGFFTSYFHMSEILVKDGDRVKRGQVLGRVGATGHVSGPHLHLAARVNGVTVDPALLLTLKP